MSASQNQSLQGATTGAKSTTGSSVVVIPAGSSIEDLIGGLTVGDGQTGTDDDLGQVDVLDLDRDQWTRVLTFSSVLKAWKRQQEGDRVHVNHAPSPAIALKNKENNNDDELQYLPEFEVADDTYIETRESRSRLERELTLKAFTESGIQAALSGGTPDVGFGLGGDFNWRDEKELTSSSKRSTTTVHAFYNFPRVIVHLHPESFKLSSQCESFLAKYGQDCLDKSKVGTVLQIFYDRFGAVLPCRITLGGRLCTAQESQTNDQANISKVKETLSSQLTSTVKASGAGAQLGGKRDKGTELNVSQSDQVELTRTTLETQGGNGLLASSIADWIGSVASYRYWRPIRQDKGEDLFAFLGEMTDGTPSSAYFRALSNCAQQGRLENRTHLEIQLEATKIPNSLKVNKEKVNVFNQTFKISVRLSDPHLVNSVQIDRGVQTLLYGQGSVTILKRRREGISELIEEDLEFGFSSLNEPIKEKYSEKLPHSADLAVRIRLESFLEWGYVGHEDLTIEDANTVWLHWPDIELHPRLEWRLPFYHTTSAEALLDKTPKDTESIAESAGDTLKKGLFKTLKKKVSSLSQQ